MRDFFKEFNIKAADPAEVEKKLAEESKKEESRLMDVANEKARIPLRFRNVRLAGCGDTKLTAETKEFAMKKANDRILVIAGPAGTGKTTLLCSAIHERALSRMSCGLYMSNRTLSQLIRTTKSFAAKENEYDLYDRLATVPFLCMDEVGTAEEPELERRFIRTLIAMRYDNELPMIMATNLTFPLLKQFLSQGGDADSVMDRLNSIIIPRVLGGESRRTKN